MASVSTVGRLLDLFGRPEPTDLTDLADQFGDVTAQIAAWTAGGVVPRLDGIVALGRSVLGEALTTGWR